jgi:hypothetical protein
MGRLMPSMGRQGHAEQPITRLYSDSSADATVALIFAMMQPTIRLWLLQDWVSGYRVEHHSDGRILEARSERKDISPQKRSASTAAQGSLKQKVKPSSASVALTAARTAARSAHRLSFSKTKSVSWFDTELRLQSWIWASGNRVLCTPAVQERPRPLLHREDHEQTFGSVE